MIDELPAVTLHPMQCQWDLTNQTPSLVVLRPIRVLYMFLIINRASAITPFLKMAAICSLVFNKLFIQAVTGRQNVNMGLNYTSLRAKFCRGNINIYLHFIPWLHIGMTRYLKSFLKYAQDLHILHSQYHGCWWPGGVSSQGISSHDIDLVKPR